MVSYASVDMHRLASAIASGLSASRQHRTASAISHRRFASAPAYRTASKASASRTSSSRVSASSLASAIAHRLSSASRVSTSHASALASGVAGRFASKPFNASFSSHVNRKLASAVAKSLSTRKNDETPSTAEVLASAISAKMFHRRDEGENAELPIAEEDIAKT